MGEPYKLILLILILVITGPAIINRRSLTHDLRKIENEKSEQRMEEEIDPHEMALKEARDRIEKKYRKRHLPKNSDRL